MSQGTLAEADASAKSVGLADVCAVVVTRRPGPDCVNNLAALAPQVRELLILDNGSTAAAFEPVEAAALQLGARIVRFGLDLGTGAALNFALESARQQGFQWLATFDQDTRASAAMLARMLRLLHAYPERSQVALVAPAQVEDFPGRTPGGAKPAGPTPAARWQLLPFAVTSGTLVNVEAASRVGGFDASLFIDYVDEDFCLRLRRSGYQILEASEVRMLSPATGMLGGHFPGQPSHRAPASSERRYYMTRNRVLLWRRYGSFDRPWLERDVRDFLSEIVAVVRFEKDLPGKLWMVARGLFDAARDARGALKRRHR